MRDAPVGRQVGAVEGVGGEGAVVEADEPVGMLDDPVGVDAHVVGHHVAGQADAALPGALAQVVAGLFAAQIPGDGIAGERVGRGDRLRGCRTAA